MKKIHILILSGLFMIPLSLYSVDPMVESEANDTMMVDDMDDSSLNDPMLDLDDDDSEMDDDSLVVPFSD